MSNVLIVLLAILTVILVCSLYKFFQYNFAVMQAAPHGTANQPEELSALVTHWQKPKPPARFVRKKEINPEDAAMVQLTATRLINRMLRSVTSTETDLTDAEIARYAIDVANDLGKKLEAVLAPVFKQPQQYRVTYELVGQNVHYLVSTPSNDPLGTLDIPTCKLKPLASNWA